MSGLARILEADQIWTPEGFRSGLRLVINDQGRIAALEPTEAPAPADLPVEKLTGRALLPGFVNAHSHAFQRGLRGRGETFPRGAGSFWTWREAMYSLVQTLDAETFHGICLQAFREMLAAGMTSVGEFHYFHHLDAQNRDYRADELVLDAARQAGIRIVLLYAYYRTGGIGAPLQGGQTHFSTPSLDEYRQRLERLQEKLDPATQSLGIVAHSIRAVDLDELAALHQEARNRGWVFHLHLEEQRQEIEACVEAYGKAPMEALLERIDPGATPTTAVHCTHTAPESMERYLDRGGNVCICPLTEANLADGIADLPGINRGIAKHQISLGSDSNARISMLEEARWLEYVQRLHLERRGVVIDDDGFCGRHLMSVVTAGGAASLGLDTGSLEAGKLADLISVDLNHPTLAFTPDAGEGLIDALFLGASDDAIDRVCVGGLWI